MFCSKNESVKSDKQKEDSPDNKEPDTDQSRQDNCENPPDIDYEMAEKKEENRITKENLEENFEKMEKNLTDKMEKNLAKIMQKLDEEKISQDKEDNKDKQTMEHEIKCQIVASTQQVAHLQEMKFKSEQREPMDRDEENISQDMEDNKDKQTTEHEVKCNIVASPPQVAHLYQQIIDWVKEAFANEKVKLTDNDETGPSVVVAVNSSRIQSDVNRDIGKKDFKEPALLIIMKPSRNVNEKPKVQLKDFQDSRIKKICFFLVDASCSELHSNNAVNNESLITVYNFLKH